MVPSFGGFYYQRSFDQPLGIAELVPFPLPFEYANMHLYILFSLV